MSEQSAIKSKIGFDKWSGRHPIYGRRSGIWWKRYTNRVIRRMFKIKLWKSGEEV